MRTIGKHWPKDAPRGDYPAQCDVCGIPYQRSQLVKNGDDGMLACSGAGTLDCANETRSATLDRMNSEMSRTAPVVPYGGTKDGHFDDDI